MSGRPRASHFYHEAPWDLAEPGPASGPGYMLSPGLHIPPSEHRKWPKNSLPVLWLHSMSLSFLASTWGQEGLVNFSWKALNNKYSGLCGPWDLSHSSSTLPLRQKAVETTYKWTSMLCLSNALSLNWEVGQKARVYWALLWITSTQVSIWHTASTGWEIMKGNSPWLCQWVGSRSWGKVVSAERRRWDGWQRAEEAVSSCSRAPGLPSRSGEWPCLRGAGLQAGLGKELGGCSWAQACVGFVVKEEDMCQGQRNRDG